MQDYRRNRLCNAAAGRGLDVAADHGLFADPAAGRVAAVRVGAGG